MTRQTDEPEDKLSVRFTWSADDIVIKGQKRKRKKPVPPSDGETAALLAHGSPGDPGYGLLHGDGNVNNLMSERQAEIFGEDFANNAYYAGFTREYNPFTDKNHPDYDPDEEAGEDEDSRPDWRGLSRFVATGENGFWFGDFESSREIRRAGNQALGLDTTGHDLLLGDGDTDDYTHVAAMTLLMGIATSPPVDRPLYRGSYIEGSNPGEVEKALRSGGDTMDFSAVSFTNDTGVADYFADPSMYQSGQAQPEGGTQVQFVVQPGAQGVVGRQFPPGMAAGTSGDPDWDGEDHLTDFSISKPREIVTGGRFSIREITRDGNRLTVNLKQEHTFDPRNGDPVT